MFPWAHIAIGYLTYTVWTKVWNARVPGGAATIALAVGTQFPDLLDKPLGWWLGVYDGRGIGHSILATVVLCGALFAVARRYNREDLAGAFTIGVGTHLVADAAGPLATGSLREAGFLLWPFVSPPTYPKDSLFDHLDVWLVQLRLLSQVPPASLLESRFGLQLALFALLVLVWALDGFPGIRTAWRLVGRSVG